MFSKEDICGTGFLQEKPSEKEFRAEEVFASFPPVTWIEKPVLSWKKYEPIRNQSNSSGCVAFTTALVLGVENLLEEGKFTLLSPRFIYSKGFEPDGGMFYTKAATIGNKEGAPLEVLLPSDGRDEAAMRDKSDERESDRQVAKTYRGGNFIYIPLEIDAIAHILSTGKAVALGTRFNPTGYQTGEIQLSPDGFYGHAVTATDFTLYKGAKALVIQNSWGKDWGFGGLGVISENQLKNGVVVAIYFQDLANTTSHSGTAPKVVIAEAPLSVSSKGAEVVKLQIALQYLGFFPNSIEATGYYGGITRKAVSDFQVARSMTATGLADLATIKALNALMV